jgi:putative heme iron utilization protein
MALTFGPGVVAAVCRHMNDDHPADSLLICRTLGGHPDATAARMTGLDAVGADFTVTLPGGGVARVRLPWSTTLTERPQIRAEVVRMYVEACALAGVPPRREHDR